MPWIKTYDSRCLNIDYFEELKIYNIYSKEKFIGTKITGVKEDETEIILRFILLKDCPYEFITALLNSEAGIHRVSIGLNDLIRDYDVDKYPSWDSDNEPYDEYEKRVQEYIKTVPIEEAEADFN